MDAPCQPLERNPAKHRASHPDHRVLEPVMAGVVGGNTCGPRSPLDMGESASLSAPTIARPLDIKERAGRAGLAQPGRRTGARLPSQGPKHSFRSWGDRHDLCRLGGALLRFMAGPLRHRDGIPGEALVSRPDGLALARYEGCNGRLPELDGIG